ncbi:hypothetical protein NPIL_695721 [Nephila pilipes]|uniref:Uncharacterized protein n=1 Tax=Nephila pilipes TaxID=299642 RepID=A0A8X6PQ27_NEPPI|nr:hypothetical protein NPIL_695721 [Nephila pilipes]
MRELTSKIESAIHFIGPDLGGSSRIAILLLDCLFGMPDLTKGSKECILGKRMVSKYSAVESNKFFSKFLTMTLFVKIEDFILRFFINPQ